MTVGRISAGLNRHGIATEIVSVTDKAHFPELPSGDLVHGFNAYHFYNYWVHKGSKSLPFMVTLTGTDLNHYLVEEPTRGRVLQALSNAKAIHVFNAKARDIIEQQVPVSKDKVFLIPQGIHEFTSDKIGAKKETGSFLFVLPAGIRRVKDVPAAISMLASLHAEEERIRLWIVGPIIEEDEGKKVQELVRQNADWVTYLGQLPHHEMGGIYASADVVLNTSVSEGQSAAILEAMSAGVPVLVSDIEGNRDIVTEGETGFLYPDVRGFILSARRLMESKELRARMGNAGKAYVKIRHSADKEIQLLANIYREILQAQVQ